MNDNYNKNKITYILEGLIRSEFLVTIFTVDLFKIHQYWGSYK